ncbi:MAG: hypothetical protein NZT61_03030 [Deltaproteobacteria bacterium]|nr:hypothetical protein [Deltaproteobacteria bacterium]
MHPQTTQEVTRQYPFEDALKQVVFSWNHLSGEDEEFVLVRFRKLVDTLRDVSMNLSASFLDNELSLDYIMHLFSPEVLENTYRFLRLLKHSSSANRSLLHELELWLILSKHQQEFYLSKLERLIKVLPDKSQIKQAALIATTLGALGAEQYDREVVEKIFNALTSNTALIPLISNSREHIYQWHFPRCVGAQRSDWIIFMARSFRLLADFSSGDVDQRLLEALTLSEDKWFTIRRIDLPKEQGQRQILLDTLVKMVKKYEQIFTASDETVAVFPHFVVSILSNPLFVSDPEIFERIIHDALNSALKHRLSDEDLAHFLVSFSLCFVRSACELSPQKREERISNELVNDIVQGCKEKRFSLLSYRIFNLFAHPAPWSCNCLREEGLSPQLIGSSLRFLLLQISAELSQYVGGQSSIEELCKDPALLKIVSIVLDLIRLAKREKTPNTRKELFSCFQTVVSVLSVLRLQGFSKAEVACSLSILSDHMFCKLCGERGGTLPFNKTSSEIVCKFARHLIIKLPDVATLILTDGHILPSLLYDHLDALIGDILDKALRSKFYSKLFKPLRKFGGIFGQGSSFGRESSQSEGHIVQACWEQLETSRLLECFQKMLFTDDTTLNEGSEGSNCVSGSAGASEFIQRKLTNLLKGLKLATDGISQDLPRGVRRAFIAKLYFQYLVRNDCPYWEYRRLWHRIVGMACYLASIASRDDDFESNFKTIYGCFKKFLDTAFEKKLSCDQVDEALFWMMDYLNTVLKSNWLKLISRFNVENIVNELNKVIRAYFEPGTFSLAPEYIDIPWVYFAAVNCGARFSSDSDLEKLCSLVEVYPFYGLKPVFSEEETFECFVLGQDSKVRIINLGSDDLSKIEKHINPSSFEKTNKRYQNWIQAIPENATFPEVFARLITYVSSKAGIQLTTDQMSDQKLEQNLTEQQIQIITAALLRYFNDTLPQLTSGIYHDRSPEAQQEIYSYLSLADQVVSHCLEQLEQYRHLIPENLMTCFDTVVKTLNSLSDHIQRQFRKCKTEASRTMKARFRLVPRKDPIDCWYGFLGDCCITDYFGNELSRPDFQPVRIVDERGYIVGYVYVVIAKVEGRMSFVVAGIEPNYLIKRRIDYDSFVEGLLGGLLRLSRKVTIDGRLVQRVYVNAGDEGKRDDGRISQLSEIRDAIRKRGKGHLKKLNRPVRFPRKYDEPIRYVYDISSAMKDGWVGYNS